VAGRGLDPLATLDAWLDAGVRLVQLRAKSLSLGSLVRAAEPMVERCRAAGALFVVNDRADAARLTGADGVHVGQTDLSPDEVRRVYPAASAIGHSTHSLGQLNASLLMPATYTAFGPVFETRTKENADAAVGLEGLREAAALIEERAVPRPLVAIGGITSATAPAVIASGAASVAVITGLLDGDPGTLARAYLAALA
jgi:thiamine-phosphate diphosphorylase